jgi:hypothetical protein
VNEEEQERHEQIMHRLEELEKHLVSIDRTTVETGNTIIGIVKAIRDIQFLYTSFFFTVSAGVIIWLLGDYGHYAFYVFSIGAIVVIIFNWHRHKSKEGGTHERQGKE